jgi:hypothetical protein
MQSTRWATSSSTSFRAATYHRESIHRDAEDFSRPGEPRRLIITEDLLDDLDAVDRPRDEQQLAVDDWLARNRPRQILALSLRKDGFPDLASRNRL